MAAFVAEVHLLATVRVPLDARTRQEAEREIADLIAAGCDIGLEALCDEPPRAYAVICADIEEA